MNIIKDLQELYCYREMLKNLVFKELRTRYKGSFLGLLWTFINPLMMLAVFSIVFSTVMRVNVEKYSMFLFCALLPWNLFQNGIQASAPSIVLNGGLIKKIYFPAAILPLSIVTTGVINYLLSLAILIPALLIFDISLNWAILTLPLILLIEFLFTLGIALVVCSVNVYFRDVEHMTGIFLMVLFYLTPVLYPEKMVPEKYMWIFEINPMTPIILAYRDIFYWGRWPDLAALAPVALGSVLVLLCGYIIFDRLKRRFAEEV